MVCFEDLNVVSVTERARSRLDKPGRDVQAAGASDQVSGIFADDRASGNVHRRRELQIPRCEGHLDQGTPHPPPRAGDDELHCSRFPGDAAATTSPSTRFIFPSSKNTAMRRYSISRLLAR